MKKYAILIFLMSWFVSSHAQINLNILLNNKNTTHTCPETSVTYKANVDVDPSTVGYRWKVDNVVQNSTEQTLGSFVYASGTETVIACTVTSISLPTQRTKASITVQTAAVPTITLSSDPDNVCTTDEVTLTAEITEGSIDGTAHTYSNELWVRPDAPSVAAKAITFVPHRTSGHQKYKFSLDDDFGCSYEESITLQGVVADFNVSQAHNEAQSDITISNESENATIYEWTFLDSNHETISTISGAEAAQTQIDYTFKKPGTYDVTLQVSWDLCSDSETYSVDNGAITVLESSFIDNPTEMSNIFTPNGDGTNDEFIFSTSYAPVSMREMSVVILNRWGRKVHEFEIENIDNPHEWKNSDVAWDGKINGGSEANSGIYFYVINAVGYDDVKYQYKGALQLLRE